MEILKTKSEIKSRINELKSKGLKIGFVPTMGALHLGHISLLKKSTEENDITVCSIFVNPTQFNNPDDLQKYPRTFETDCEILERNNCNIVFNPSESEMYPEPDNRVFDFEGLDKVMEGKFREGHFNGVAQIVSKLFEVVHPHKAYFGIKDFQQLAIIRLLNRKYLNNLNIEIVSCEIIRESDGLALSSRNVRLNAEERYEAILISDILYKAQARYKNFTVEALKELVFNTIDENQHMETEYFEIVDENTLQPIQNWNDSEIIRGCIAVYVGEVRLIDNVKIK